MNPESTKMAQEQQEALLHAQRPEEAAAADRDHAVAGAGFPWLTLLGFAFLTFNSVLAIHRSKGDWAAIAFVIFSYLDLVLLFVCLRWYERAAPDSATRGRLKVAVWLLTTLLTMVFTYKVAAIMPVAVKVLVWVMACATVLGGFYAFFVHAEPKVRRLRGLFIYLIRVIFLSASTASYFYMGDSEHVIWTALLLSKRLNTRVERPSDANKHNMM